MGKLIIMVGNIGSGKSFLASKLAQNGSVVVNMDNIQQGLAGGEYGIYDPNKKDIYHAVEIITIATALDHGFDVVIDRTNMDKKTRKRFIDLGKKYTDGIICYDYGPGGREGLKRRLENPHGIPASQWSQVFDVMCDRYEKPVLDEGFSQILFPPEQFTFHAFDFDGTIAENDFPETGDIIPKTVEKINKLWKNYSNVIIIWTCRAGDDENQARAFLIKHNIPFDFINENPFFEMGSRKIFAHVYHDDRNE